MTVISDYTMRRGIIPKMRIDNTHKMRSRDGERSTKYNQTGGCFLLHPGANAQTHSLNFEGGGCFLEIWFFLFDEINIKSYRGEAWNAKAHVKKGLQLITK